ncbi:MAG: HNH endonuclease [Methanobrevibacter sp.]|jgi:5-methylcytosine-specific restriction protein A|nr:HNH endonuclease [Candidatus Methanoflexus mossambicus]
MTNFKDIPDDGYFWQAPGNGRPFDSKLNDWKSGDMSSRTIGVLKFLETKGSISKSLFEEKIGEYLDENFAHEENKSLKTHFYRPLEFIGFIRNIGDTVSISTRGKNFLKEIEAENYDKALKFFILQLLETKYPNSATKNVKLSLFPFSILFKMLLNKPINKKLFENRIPFINSLDDVNNFYSNVYDNSLIKHSHKKFNSWVISSLIVLGILERDNKKIWVGEKYKSFIKNFLNNVSYEDLFFSNEEEINCKKERILKFKRDKKIVDNVLSECNYKCFINSEHITFPTNDKKNYVEGHHVIPLRYSDSFDNSLDCKDNIIPLCPNCHKEIHFAIDENKSIILEKIFQRNLKLKTFNIEIDDLKEYYFK